MRACDSCVKNSFFSPYNMILKHKSTNSTKETKVDCKAGAKAGTAEELSEANFGMP